MEKYRIYRAIAFITLLFGLANMFSAYWLSSDQMNMLSMFSMFTGMLMFVCYGLLVSIFNFYNDPLWKKLSVWLFIAGTIVFNSVITLQYGEFEWVDFILLLFYMPIVLAFVTVKHKEIKPFAQSFGYILLIICLLRIALPFFRDSTYFSVYAYAFSFVYMLPIALIAALFHRMINASENANEEETRSEGDLL